MFIQIHDIMTSIVKIFIEIVQNEFLWRHFPMEPTPTVGTVISSIPMTTYHLLSLMFHSQVNATEAEVKATTILWVIAPMTGSALILSDFSECSVYDCLIVHNAGLKLDV